MEKIANSNKSGEQLVLSPVKKQKPYFYIVLISAFVGALLLWLYAIGYDSTIFERDITNIPVTITGVDKLYQQKKFMVADELNIEITVTISGKRSQIYSISSEDLRATVDVSNIEKAGESKIPITVTAPNGIKIKELSTSSVVLYLDEFIVKTVPVNAIYSDYILPDGLKLGEVQINPVVTTLEGPSSELSKISAAYVELSLGEVGGAIEAHGPIFLKYDSGERVNNKYIKLASTEAYVSLPVYKEKTIPIDVEFTGGVFTAESAVIELSQQTLTISGRIDLVDSIEKVVLEFDETGVNLKQPQTVTKYFSELLPAGISVESGEALLTAKIRIPDITTKYFFIPSSQIAGVQGNSDNEIKAESGVTVTVIGFRDVLKGMTPKSVIASVNAENVFTDNKDNTVAYVDFAFADGLYGIYVPEDYTIKVKIQ